MDDSIKFGTSGTGMFSCMSHIRRTSTECTYTNSSGAEQTEG
jgi:hypothetical protein